MHLITAHCNWTKCNCNENCLPQLHDQCTHILNGQHAINILRQLKCHRTEEQKLFTLYSIKLNLKIMAQKMYITKAEVTLFQAVCPAKWSLTLKLRMHNKWAHTCYLSLLLSAKWQQVAAWENHTYSCVTASIQPMVNKLVNHRLLFFLIRKLVPNSTIIYKSYTL
jgi:hypothetical protein